MSDDNWNQPGEPEGEASGQPRAGASPGGDPLSGQEPPPRYGDQAAGSGQQAWRPAGDDQGWKQPADEQPWRAADTGWKQPGGSSGWKQPDEQPTWNQPGAQPAWRQPEDTGEQPSQPAPWGQASEQPGAWGRSNEQPAAWGQTGGLPAWGQPGQPQQPGSSSYDGMNEAHGEQPPGESAPPNPWQGAYPAGEQHPASQSPYGPRQVEGVPAGWAFPPPVRPGQSPAGAPIQLPRGSFGTLSRRRRTRKALIAILAALAVIVVGGGVALALTRDGGDTPVTAPTEATPTPTPTPSPSPSPTLSTPTVNPKPTPPKPKPEPKPSLNLLVSANPLYKSGRVLASRCHEPAARPTSFATVRAYYSQFLPCLNKSWAPSLKRSGYPFRAPKLVVYGGKIKSPCGFTSRPWYCGVNETIYMPWNVDVVNYRTNQEWARTWMAQTFAHEYGHHVQQLTGILPASWARQRLMTSAGNKLLESRRRELQASCFAGVYLGTDRSWFPMRGTFLTRWRWTISHSGDEYGKPRVRDHGAAASNNYWSLRGWNGVRPSSCNTFAAATTLTR